MTIMNRREALKAALVALAPVRLFAAPSVSTLVGSGAPGHSESAVSNPYGLVIGPDELCTSAIWTIRGSGGSTFERID